MSQDLEKDVAWETDHLGFIYRQLFVTQPKPTETPGTPLISSGQTAVVTGSNAGLGLEAARQLLQLGLRELVLAVRSQERADAAAVELRTQFPTAEIRVWILDMASYDSVVAFAKRCEEGLSRLDIAILNARGGTNFFKRSETTGYEMTLQVNNLSTALLASLLLPVLRAKREALKLGSSSTGEGKPAAPARLRIFSSDTHYWSFINHGYPDILASGESVLAYLSRPDGFDMAKGYRGSKLLLTMFVAGLAGYVRAGEVVVNVVNPGLTKGTQFFREGAAGPWLINLVFKHLIVRMSRTVEVGASAYVDATVWKGKETHGSFVSEWTIKPYPSIAYSEDGRAFLEKVWEETMEELKFANISGILARMKSGA